MCVGPLQDNITAAATCAKTGKKTKTIISIVAATTAEIVFSSKATL